MPKDLFPKPPRTLAIRIRKATIKLLTWILRKPALASLSFTHFTAWKGVGDALTNERKSFAAAAVLAGIIVAFF
jgi:hypothetical protein